ncbi:MAG: pyridoxal phosphate-dependent aminotransferase [Pseudobdellovibrionaceae bacterium]
MNKNEVSWNLLQDFSYKFDQINRYPNSEEKNKLIQNLSNILKFPQKNIALFAGGDQIIDLFCLDCMKMQKKRIGILRPSFEMFTLCAQKYNLEISYIDLDERGQLPPSNQLNQLLGNIDALILCSPNNPTGTIIEPNKISSMLNSFVGPVLIDQAYLEFSSFVEMCDLKNFALMRRNTVILRTFSKAWGLASARIGYALAEESTLARLGTLTLPFSISSQSIFAANLVLTQLSRMQTCLEEFKKERKRAFESLIRLGHFEKVLHSDANFFFAKPNGMTEQIFKSSALPNIRQMSSFNQTNWSKNFIRIGIEYNPPVFNRTDSWRKGVSDENQNIYWASNYNP